MQPPGALGRLTGMRIAVALAGAALALLAVSGCSTLSTTTSDGAATVATQSPHAQGQIIEISYSPGATVAVRVGERFTLESGLQIAETGGNVVQEQDGVWRAVTNGNVIVADYTDVAPCSDAEPVRFNLTVYGGDESLSDGLRRAPVIEPHPQCG